MCDVVRIHPREEGRARGLEGGVERGDEPTSLRSQHAEAPVVSLRLQELVEAAVDRTVVDGNDLVVGERLPAERSQAVAKMRVGVANG
jgi:hypothetical protein